MDQRYPVCSIQNAATDFYLPNAVVMSLEDYSPEYKG